MRPWVRPVPILDRVKPEAIDDLWPHLEPYFRRAYEVLLTDLTPDEIRAGAKTGRRQIWTVTERGRASPLLTAFCTAMRVADGRKWLVFEALAGEDMEAWLPLLSEFEGYAKEAGASVSHIQGRRGWERVLRPYGYELKSVILEKVLT